MKQIIRLTESDLHRMIKESVKQVLSEGSVVNNKPWVTSEKFKKGKEAYYKNRKDWENFANQTMDMHDDDIVNRAREILSSPEQEIANDWEYRDGVHNQRLNKRYKDDDTRQKENDELRRYKAQRIKDLGPEWDTMSYEEKKKEMEIAEEDFYEMMTLRYMDHEYEY